MKSRYWLSVYPAEARPRGFRKILEATKGSLRYYDPSRRDSLVRTMTSLLVFFSVLAGYVLLVRLVVTIFSEFYSFNGLDNVPVFVLVYGPVVIGFGVTAFFSAGFSNHLATKLELRLTARHPERTFRVHVSKIKPTSSGLVQLLELINDGWARWFNVPVTGKDIQDALNLANEKIKVELNG